MLCAKCGTDTPPPLDHCRRCAAPLVVAAGSFADETTFGESPGQRSPSASSSDNDRAVSGIGRHTGARSSAAESATVFPTPTPDSALEIGEMFGRYRIIRLLGAGGMGQVYHAWDEELGEAVALKVIRREFAGSADADARFKRELSVARQVTHTNVVRIHDLGIIGGVRYISMPFIDGLDLATMLDGGRLPQDLALSIARQLCSGLAAAHQAAIVHRDLKPANVMIDASGHAFLMDFGLARSVDVTQFTQAGVVMGTVEYMSPEQAMGEPADRRSDIYTLGLILFEMFTGERPFKGETPMSRLTARLHKPAPDLRTTHPDVPPYLAKIIGRCLERDPAMRYQSVEGIVADLDAQAASRRARRIAPRWLTVSHAAAAVAALAILAGGGYFVSARLTTSRASDVQNAGTVAPAVSLAVVPFRNASGDPSLDWLSPSLGEMLATGIGQSSAVRTASFGRLQQIVRDLHLAADATLDGTTLRRIADFTGADTVVSGRYVRAGDQVRIDAVVQDFRRSQTVELQPVTVPAKEVLHASDALAGAIRQALAVSPDVVKELRASAFRPSSQSPDAIRSYMDGLQAAREGNYAAAEKAFEKSTTEDGQFALAYSQLGLALSALGRDDEAERASRRALQLSDSLPPRERYLVLANHARVVNDTAKAIDAYANLARVSPDDSDVQYTLASLYETAGSLDKAREGYARVLARDPKRVDALLAAGRVEVKRGTPQAAIDYFNRGLSLAIQVENDEQKGRILQAIGIAYKRLNKPEEALRYYQEALTIRRQLGQKGGIAASLSEIAEADRVLGRTREAQAGYHEALQLQREIGDKRGIATNTLNLASFLADRGQHADSLKLFKEALQLHRELADEAGQALCLNDIGTVYFAEGQYDDALTYFQQALQIRQKLNVPADVAETLHNIAESSAKMGQYDQALTQYLKALELYRSAGDRQGAAIESYATGKIFEIQGRYGAALAAKEEALKAFRAAGDKSYWMVNILAGYGETLVLVGRRQDAGRALDEALLLARGLGNQALMAQTVNYQGDSLFFAGDYERARGMYEQAARLAVAAGDREQAAVTKVNLAKVAVKQDRADAVSAARAARAEADALGLRHLSAQCSLSVAEALVNRRQDAQAREEIDAVLAKSEKFGLGGLLAPAHYLLARSLSGPGQANDAAREFAEARRLAEIVHKEAGTDTILARSDLAPILKK